MVAASPSPPIALATRHRCRPPCRVPSPAPECWCWWPIRRWAIARQPGDDARAAGRGRLERPYRCSTSTRSTPTTGRHAAERRAWPPRGCSSGSARCTGTRCRRCSSSGSTRCWPSAGPTAPGRRGAANRTSGWRCRPAARRTPTARGYNRYFFDAFLPPMEQTAALCGMRFLPPLLLHGAHHATDRGPGRPRRSVRRRARGQPGPTGLEIDELPGAWPARCRPTPARATAALMEHGNWLTGSLVYLAAAVLAPCRWPRRWAWADHRLPRRRHRDRALGPGCHRPAGHAGTPNSAWC